jgi:predicted anti-sigma-YlaC factor YlaD
MKTAKWLGTLGALVGLTAIMWFFTPVGERASELYRLACCDDWIVAHRLRMSALSDFVVAAVFILAACFFVHKLRPSWLQIGMAVIFWAFVVGQFSLS